MLPLTSAGLLCGLPARYDSQTAGRVEGKNGRTTLEVTLVTDL